MPQPSLRRPSLLRLSLLRLSLLRPSLRRFSLHRPSLHRPFLHHPFLCRSSSHRFSLHRPFLCRSSLHRFSLQRPFLHRPSLHTPFLHSLANPLLPPLYSAQVCLHYLLFVASTLIVSVILISSSHTLAFLSQPLCFDLPYLGLSVHFILFLLFTRVNLCLSFLSPVLHSFILFASSFSVFHAPPARPKFIFTVILYCLTTTILCSPVYWLSLRLIIFKPISLSESNFLL